MPAGYGCEVYRRKPLSKSGLGVCNTTKREEKKEFGRGSSMSGEFFSFKIRRRCLKLITKDECRTDGRWCCRRRPWRRRPMLMVDIFSIHQVPFADALIIIQSASCDIWLPYIALYSSSLYCCCEKMFLFSVSEPRRCAAVLPFFISFKRPTEALEMVSAVQYIRHTRPLYPP